MSEALLTVANLTAGYGAAPVLFEIEFEVERDRTPPKPISFE